MKVTIKIELDSLETAQMEALQVLLGAREFILSPEKRVEKEKPAITKKETTELVETAEEIFCSKEQIDSLKKAMAEPMKSAEKTDLLRKKLNSLKASKLSELKANYFDDFMKYINSIT
jgi:hypothetical protein